MNQECKLTSCLMDYGGNDELNFKTCRKEGHILCKCDHCQKWPCCLRCRLWYHSARFLGGKLPFPSQMRKRDK